jgi:hypothetical protein
VGALGATRNSGDPAFSTAGVLDNLLGQQPPALDPLAPLKPSDPVRSGGGLLDGMLSPLGGGSETLADSTQAASEIAPENTRSLFSRVHSVHEKALQRGAVLLFHRKL